MFRHSIILITKDRPREISVLLENLGNQTLPPHEIIVVDASVNDAVEIVTNNASTSLPDGNIVYVRTKANISSQKNVGIEKAGGDIISFFDDDAAPSRNYCETVLKRFECDTDKHIGGIGGLLLNPKKRSGLETAFRKLFLIQSDAGKNTYRYSGFPDAGFVFKTETEVEFLAAGAMSLRLEAVGNERFEEYWLTGAALSLDTGRGFLEDTLFTTRIGKSHSLLISPEATYTHNPSPQNRDNTHITQALYVFALRYVSRLNAPGLLRKACRFYALAGQGLLAVLQTIVYRNTGYCTGFIKAITARLSSSQAGMQ